MPSEVAAIEGGSLSHFPALRWSDTARGEPRGTNCLLLWNELTLPTLQVDSERRNSLNSPLPAAGKQSTSPGHRNYSLQEHFWKESFLGAVGPQVTKSCSLSLELLSPDPLKVSNLHFYFIILLFSSLLSAVNTHCSNFLGSTITIMAIMAIFWLMISNNVSPGLLLISKTHCADVLPCVYSCSSDVGKFGVDWDGLALY